MRLAIKEDRRTNSRKAKEQRETDEPQSEASSHSGCSPYPQPLPFRKTPTASSQDPASLNSVRLSSPIIPTVFHEDWWLDAATDGNFSVVEVMSGGRTVGRLPFTMTSRRGS